MEEREMVAVEEAAREAAWRATQLGCGIGVFVGLSNLFTNGMVLGVLYASLKQTHAKWGKEEKQGSKKILWGTRREKT